MARNSFKGYLHIGIEDVRIESPIYKAVERKPTQKGPTKKTTTAKDAIEEEKETLTTTTITIKVPVVKSDDGKLDIFKQAKKKKKKAKTFDATSQPKDSITKVPTKKPVSPKVLAKTTSERLETDNSSPGAEGSMEDTNILEAEEDVQEKSNDASPDIPHQARDISDDEEEHDKDQYMLDIPSADDQNEQEEDDEENDANDEGRSGGISS
ncbi:uncharacterized protein LOC127079819 [Lathyrus oleraceus]|uniref:uncharacterized protein LOC127079819 n=1 Tax=Pisum sativum TaxID=3888 RepID=UPI0021D3653F|nr:uncharacterized protein LOC127079819 [Pisum sativum]